MDSFSGENPQEPQQSQQRIARPAPKFMDSNRVLIKAAVIASLIFVMLIPSAFISNLVQERAIRQEEIMKEVSSKWAMPQTLNGPILMLPYEVRTDYNGKTMVTKKKAYFLPEKLDIAGDIKPEERKRSIYSVTLYKSDVTLSGNFNKLDLASLNIAPENVQWADAQILIGINDPGGLEDEALLNWNGHQQNIETTIAENSVIGNGLATSIACNASDAFNFKIHLKVKGSEYLYFTPAGKNTTVNIRSPWENPKFDGKYLANDNQKAAGGGFIGKWHIPQTARAVPQAWIESRPNLTSYAFGVKLIQPVDTYSKTERAVKYALLFIGLSFTIFFFIEILQKHQIHPLQYFLVGIALTVFYTLLLSFSEYIGFNIAYLIAALATVTLIGLYVWNIFKEGKIAFGFTVALSGLYGYIFFLIQLQDYALLVGSIGLFLVVALVMYSSRKVNWYQIGRKEVLATH